MNTFFFSKMSTSRHAPSGLFPCRFSFQRLLQEASRHCFCKHFRRSHNPYLLLEGKEGTTFPPSLPTTSLRPTSSDTRTSTHTHKANGLLSASASAAGTKGFPPGLLPPAKVGRGVAGMRLPGRMQSPKHSTNHMHLEK